LTGAAPSGEASRRGAARRSGGRLTGRPWVKLMSGRSPKVCVGRQVRGARKRHKTRQVGVCLVSCRGTGEERVARAARYREARLMWP
jgi:hypothetical protein